MVGMCVKLWKLYICKPHYGYEEHMKLSKNTCVETFELWHKVSRSVPWGKFTLKEEDFDIVHMMLHKTTDAAGNPVKVEWKNVHSRIYHAVYAKFKKDGAAYAKLRGAYAAKCGRYIWDQKPEDTRVLKVFFLKISLSLHCNTSWGTHTHETSLIFNI